MNFYSFMKGFNNKSIGVFIFDNKTMGFDNRGKVPVFSYPSHSITKDEYFLMYKQTMLAEYKERNITKIHLNNDNLMIFLN